MKEINVYRHIGLKSGLSV